MKTTALALAAVCSAVAVVASASGQATTPATAPSAAPATRAVSGDDAFDPEKNLLSTRFTGTGYHSTIAPGTVVHPTLQSMHYALRLLETDDPARHARAADVIRAVLPQQETRPESPWFGTWPYNLQEPVEKMSPPDMNWAAFVGVQICEMLVRYPERLPAEVKGEMKAALARACAAVAKRDVQPGYTNIYAMSAALVAISGDVLDDAALRVRGRVWLGRLIEWTEANGGFTEYNSPHYYPVTLAEVERVVRLASDREAVARAEVLRRMTWGYIAEHFHPATGEWAGPHSRVYSDRIRPTVRTMMARRTGERIGKQEPGDAAKWPETDRDPRLRCPEELVGRFRALPSEELVVTRDYLRDAEDPSKDVRGTTWMSADATLGTINRDSLWTQRRPLIGYWVSGEDVAVLKVRCLKDGKDWASGELTSAQAGPRALSSVRFVADKGDWHLFMDRPKDGRFELSDLRVRMELTGPGAKVTRLGEDAWELSSGGRRAVVRTATLGASPLGTAVEWATGEDTAGGAVWVEAVLYRGERVPFVLNAPTASVAAFGVELLAPGRAATGAAVTGVEGGAAWTPADGVGLRVGG